MTIYFVGGVHVVFVYYFFVLWVFGGFLVRCSTREVNGLGCRGDDVLNSWRKDFLLFLVGGVVLVERVCWGFLVGD